MATQMKLAVLDGESHGRPDFKREKHQQSRDFSDVIYSCLMSTLTGITEKKIINKY